MDGKEAGAAAQWAIATLLDEARRMGDEHARGKPGDGVVKAERSDRETR
jgi:hypothetical protein